MEIACLHAAMFGSSCARPQLLQYSLRILLKFVPDIIDGARATHNNACTLRVYVNFNRSLLSNSKTMSAAESDVSEQAVKEMVAACKYG